MQDQEVKDIIRETIVIELRLKEALNRNKSNVVLDDMQRLIGYIFRMYDKLENK